MSLTVVAALPQDTSAMMQIYTMLIMQNSLRRELSWINKEGPGVVLYLWCISAGLSSKFKTSERTIQVAYSQMRSSHFHWQRPACLSTRSASSKSPSNECTNAAANVKASTQSRHRRVQKISMVSASNTLPSVLSVTQKSFRSNTYQAAQPPSEWKLQSPVAAIAALPQALVQKFAADYACLPPGAVFAVPSQTSLQLQLAKHCGGDGTVLTLYQQRNVAGSKNRR